MKTYLVLDIGTSGIKAFLFDQKLKIIKKEYQRLPIYRPKTNWVEQKPTDFIKISKSLLKKLITKQDLGSIQSFGITNQRETFIAWDKNTGKAIYPAIVWKDTRTKKLCSRLKKKYQAKVKNLTGLALDPYFSASKINWLIKTSPQTKKLIDSKKLLIGTVDSWLLYNLSKEQSHLTDYTNASRTLLFDIHKLEWSPFLLKIFSVPGKILPKTRPSKARFGTLKKEIIGKELPIKAIAGDQQASLYAATRGIKKAGMTKITYGTGTFTMQTLGTKFLKSKKFFTTLTADIPKPRYALEGKFSGSGEEARKLLDKKESLEPLMKKLAKETNKFIKALPHKPKKIIVDGGVSQSNILLEEQAKVSKIKIEKQTTYDGTALGVAYLLKN